MPLGEWVAADEKPDDRRHEIWSWDDEGHRLIVGPSGSGKYQAAIAPLLLTADKASVIVFDIADGEAARDTAGHRAKLGSVAVLDPFGIRGGTGTLNPLDMLKADDPALLSKARRLADALMIFPANAGSAAYWNGQALNFMVALLIHVATDPSEAATRTLKRVREIIRRPFNPPMVESDPFPNGTLLKAMKSSTIADGIVRDEAENMTAAEAERNAFYIQQTMRENTAFLDLPELQQVTARSSLNLRGLRAQVSTLYVVLPEYELRNASRWLRLIYAVIMEEMRVAVIGADPKAAVPLHVILDEFPTFGSFTRVKDDMALVRRFGIRMHLAVQKLSQLRSLYGDAWEIFVPTVLHVLGCDEQMTAEYVSKRLGTVDVPKLSESHDRRSTGGSQSTTRSTERRPYREPHEVILMDRDRCWAIFGGYGQNPIDVRKWWFFNSPYLRARAAR